jgi:ethanolamine ammonia-lyase large subunit
MMSFRKKSNALSARKKLNLDCIVQRDPEVLAAQVDEDVIMVSITNGFYYGVSDVARGIWDAIERPKKVSELIDDLTETYNVDRSKCEEETLLFLEELLTERLLQVKDGSLS